MRSSRTGLPAVALVCAGTLGAAVFPKIDLPKDSPVAVLSADYGDSNETARGGAMVVDLRAALSLRNSTSRRIRGITLVVTAQEVTPGGKGSVTIPNLDVGPNETFPVHIDLRLLRPLPAVGGLPIVVGLDGVLFEDLGFYGPDKLGSKRTLTVCELEARRDRRYFKTLLAEGGPERLRSEIVASMQRQADRPGMDVQMVRGGRVTNVDEKQLQFAFLKMPDSPVEPIQGMAYVSDNWARAPSLEVKNRSDKSVRYLEIGWILRDRAGRNFLAGSVPAEMSLGPGQRNQVLKDTTIKFPQRPGQAMSIEGMTGYVSTVEFTDGNVWIPSRADLADPVLKHVVGPSPEEQRLVRLYSKKGLNAVVDELKKF